MSGNRSTPTSRIEDSAWAWRGGRDGYKWGSAVLVVALHAAIVLLLWLATAVVQRAQAPATVSVDVIRDEPDSHSRPKAAPPPMPVHAAVVVPPMEIIVPPPLITIATTTDPSPSTPPTSAGPSSPIGVPGGSGQGAPKVAARFDLATLRNPAPRYPYSARDKHEEGLVVVKVHVSAEGAALDVTLHKSSGVPALDDAAMEVVRTWRFIPARFGDFEVDDWVLVPFNFRLRSVHKPS